MRYTTPVRAAVYLRISEDRSGEQLGVARQREDCLKLCGQRKWVPVEYLDNDVSASTGKRRPAYEQMLADITAGKIAAVVAWDLDRLHRRPIELEAFMSLADEKRLALATVAGDVDLATPQGRLVARLKGSVAAHETEHKKARQRRAARQKAERGHPNWSKAFGYLPGPNGPEPDPRTAPLVKQAYADILAGASLGDVCRQWNDAGAFTITGRPWTTTTLSKFLRKPRNAGLRAYKGARYGPVDRDAIVGKAQWSPLVDEATFWAAQAVLDAPGRAPGRKSVRRHLLTGLAGCGKCGNHLAGSYRTDGQVVYVCKACHGVAILADNIEPILYHIVAERLAMPDAVDLLRREIHDAAEAETIRLELETLYGELDRLAVERAEGLLTARQVKISTDIVNAKITKLQARQQDQERLRVFDGIPLGTPQVAGMIAELSPDRFRAVLDVLAEVVVQPVGKSGRIFNPERVQVNWR
ncbi:MULTISPECIES: recombinase family protein [Mycobacterium]|uniref:Integrase n=36 Tax=Mycobacterium tuberculosis TaxID=1773 RepID=A5U2U2_MYCTA|nr:MULTISPECIES: recombinase family protein [Mycobacterium]NP_216102.1 phage integrase [Mycobacterium tuberculosis H37Rv]EFD13198.1 phi integrase [Mycobacterium tuberculosis T46]EFO75260.1 resolvase, N domain protein [Mycobacterium tuberculosis SUMu001]KAM35137.1 prophage PhiRv1 integrase [Mycobacterium tuberculosis 2101HD]MBA2790153.1 recombinase family protein [Mycobacterium canetti]ABQ73342.1 putative integrase [Mycobacterium tuberculosis H37Ra]